VGVGTTNSPTTFHRVEVVEITGHGEAVARPVLPSAEPEAAGRKVNLLPLIDPARDAITGGWKFAENGELVINRVAGGARLEIPYRPPAEYDYVIEYTRARGNDDVAQMLFHGKTGFAWAMGARGGSMSLFTRVNGKGIGNPTSVKTQHVFTPARRYRSVVSVRNEGVTAALDGRKLAEWRTDYKDLSPSPLWTTRTEGVLGLGTNNTATWFHRIEIIEITGRGQIVRRGATGGEKKPAARE
jgi:hypothetical protein